MYRSALVGVVLVACSSPSNPVAGDGGTDAAPPACAPFDITVPGVSWLGHPIWTGSEYLVLTQGNPGGVIQRVNADGTLGSTMNLGIDVLIDTSWPIAWTGSELGVVYSVPASNGNDLKLARYSLDGTQISTSTVAEGVPNLLDSRSLIWAGDRYVLAWVAMGNPDIATIEEVSADGVVGTTNSVSDRGDVIFALASTPETHLAIVASYQGGHYPTYVTIDRATGMPSQHDASIGLASQRVLARGHDFIGYNGSVPQDGGSRTGALQTIDASGMETASIPAPELNAPDMIAAPDHYHLTSFSTDASGYSIDDVDVDFSGSAGPINVRATFPQSGSFTGQR
jgi:hypothetical protein